MIVSNEDLVIRVKEAYRLFNSAAEAIKKLQEPEGKYFINTILKTTTMPIKKTYTKPAAKPAVKAVKKGKSIVVKATKSAKKK